jgi:ribonuclease HI
VDGEAYGPNVALNHLEAFVDTQVIIETDSSTIVTAVQKRQYPRCYWGRIAKRCGALLDQNPIFKIVWVRRSGNAAFHVLAH